MKAAAALRIVLHCFFAAVFVLLSLVLAAVAGVWNDLEAGLALRAVLIVQAALGACFLLALWRTAALWLRCELTPSTWTPTPPHAESTAAGFRRWRRVVLATFVALLVNTLVFAIML